MSLFNKKKQPPALHNALDLQVTEAREKGRTSFYYPLKEDEIKQAEVWAMNHRYWLRISHKTGNNFVYKISGFFTEEIV